jgi:hypothetical protein
LKSRFILFCIYVSIFCLIFANIGYAKIDPKTFIGAWLFDEGKGDTVKDWSENGNDGKISGAKWIDGKFGKALEFDGATSKIDIPDSDNLNGLNEITILSWVYLRRAVTSGTWNSLAGKNPYSNGYLMWIELPQEPCGLVYAGGARFDDRSGVSLDLKKWYHLAFTRNVKGEMKFYIDGVLTKVATSTAGPISTIPGPLAIGGQSPQILDGFIDEVIMFNTALTENDVNAIMKNGLERANDVSSADKLTTSWGKAKTQY